MTSFSDATIHIRGLTRISHQHPNPHSHMLLLVWLLPCRHFLFFCSNKLDRQNSFSIKQAKFCGPESFPRQWLEMVGCRLLCHTTAMISDLKSYHRHRDTAANYSIMSHSSTVDTVFAAHLRVPVQQQFTVQYLRQKDLVLNPTCLVNRRSRRN